MIALILTTRKWTPSNALLVAILSVLSFSVLPTLFGHLGLVVVFDGLLFVPLHLQAFIFPLLYLYSKSLFSPDFRLNKRTSLHLVLPLGFWLYFCFVWINTLGVPVAYKRELALGLYYFWVSPLQDVMVMLMALGYSWAAFMTLRKAEEQKVSKQKSRYTTWFRWLLILLLLGAAMDLFSVSLGQIYGYWRGSPLDEWLGYPVSLLVKDYYALVVYILSVVGYTSYSTLQIGQTVHQSRATSDDLSRITALMEVDRIYLDPALTLGQLAKALGTTSGKLSATLNHGLGMSFNDLVNQYRVEEVKTKLASDQIDHYTLVGLAFDSGFSSKTTFYRAFQKFTGHTPKAYLEQVTYRQ
ncbi:MAG: helix-turn-helix domain-containing protein [Cyclobacteriaceae bacterium]